MSTTMTTQEINLSWVTAAGGPEVKCEDGRRVTGLPEQGWWAWPDAKHEDQSAGLKLYLHTEWAEPVTEKQGPLMCSLEPHSKGVAWEASFMYRLGADDGESPVRGRGIALNFSAAHAAALTWRPHVMVIDGVELWTDPESGDGKAIGLRSGDLTWRRGDAAGGRVLWRFEPVGLIEVFQAIGHWPTSITGACDTLEQMLIEVSEARERIRAAMRRFLLS
jgi:hypothetical protein